VSGIALVVGNVRVSEGRETVKQRNGGEDDFEPPWQRIHIAVMPPWHLHSNVTSTLLLAWRNIGHS
jgi:hypothetical protein